MGNARAVLLAGLVLNTHGSVVEGLVTLRAGRSLHLRDERSTKFGIANVLEAAGSSHGSLVVQPFLGRTRTVLLVGLVLKTHGSVVEGMTPLKLADFSC